MASYNEEEFLRILKDDPGNPLWVDYAETLRLRGSLLAGLEVCLKGLSANSSLHRGRLLLARFYYEMACVPFALREIESLCSALPESRSIRRLANKLLFQDGQTASLARSTAPAAAGETTVAEADFALEELDLIEKEDEESE